MPHLLSMENPKYRTWFVFGLALIATSTLFYFEREFLDFGWAIIVLPISFLAFLLMAEFAFDIFELIWKIVAKPEERLHSAISLGFTVFILVALYGAYRLVEGSIGMPGMIMLGIAAYLIFQIVRWFKRHTAAYYTALEAERERGDGA